MSYEFTAASSQYIEWNGSTIIPVSDWPMSLSVWFKTKSLDAGTIFSIGSTTNNRRVQLYVDTSGRIVLYTWGGSSSSSVVGKILTIGKWHHAHISIETSRRRYLYVDGVYEGISSSNLTVPPFNRMYLGARLNTTVGNFFDGYIGDIGMWNIMTSTSYGNTLWRETSQGPRQNRIDYQKLVWYDSCDKLNSRTGARDLVGNTNGVSFNGGPVISLDHPRLF